MCCLLDGLKGLAKVVSYHALFAKLDQAPASATNENLANSGFFRAFHGVTAWEGGAAQSVPVRAPFQSRTPDPGLPAQPLFSLGSVEVTRTGQVRGVSGNSDDLVDTAWKVAGESETVRLPDVCPGPKMAQVEEVSEGDRGRSESCLPVLAL